MITGNNLSNKIAEMSVKKSGGAWVTLWNRSLPDSSLAQQRSNLFQVANLINGDNAVDFCHTVDLSALAYRIDQVLIRAVDDITLVVHLAGQLFRSPAYYEVVNSNTLRIFDNVSINLYGAEVGLLLEATSFQNVSTGGCVEYNATWTYDNCLLDFALDRMSSQKELLNTLLRPNGSQGVAGGVESSILQDLFSELMSSDVDAGGCKPDCQSLKVGMMVEASTALTVEEQKRAFRRLDTNVSQPLPSSININVNLTIPELSKVNEVSSLLQYLC